MLRTNENRLVKTAVQGKPVNPGGPSGHGVNHDGIPVLLPSTGGITYNVKVGDSAFGWEADHLEPCVSTLLNEEKRHDGPNSGYIFYSCMGNEAFLLGTGPEHKLEDHKGIVTGHHGGAEHLMIDFPDSVLEKMNYDSKILVKAFGQGLKLIDYPDIFVYNLDPRLLHAMNIEENNGKLSVPVTMEIPAALMGSGTGSLAMGKGDYDIMTTDRAYIKELGIDQMRLGDFVAIRDHDNSYGRSYRRGAITIGIIIHSDCVYAGHGPGVTTLLSTNKALIEPRIDPEANIANRLQIGRSRV
jgi:hypothetical protein